VKGEGDENQDEHQSWFRCLGNLIDCETRSRSFREDENGRKEERDESTHASKGRQHGLGRLIGCQAEGVRDARENEG
jgi:hypothetical protein